MMFSAVISFVTGIIVIQQFSELPETVWIVGIFLFIIGLAFFRRWQLMFFAMGLLWAIVFASMRLADQLPEHLQGQLFTVEGKVVGIPQYDGRKVRFDFAISNSDRDLPEKIRLSWFHPEQQLMSGQIWQFTVKLKMPYGRLNPNGFDYERWLFTQNIGATGYVKNKPKPILLTINPVWKSFDSVRQSISSKLDNLIADSENIGVIKALTIGERHNISEQQWQIFRNTGTVHLLAISGLHIGLIAGLAYLLMFNLSLRFTVNSPQGIAAFFAIITAILYSALAGFSLPTQRALLMLSVAMITITCQRNSTSKNTLSLAMLVILMVDPLAVLSAGFWLSFLAVAVIVYCLSGRLGKVGYWYSAIKIHWITAIGLSPLLLLYFQQVSIVAPVANLITVPVISLLVVPLCLTAVLLMFLLPQIAEYLLLFADTLLQGLWFILSPLPELHFSTITSSSIPLYAMPLALIGVFVLLSPKGIPVRWLGGVMLLPLIFVEIKRPSVGEVKMTLLDVGQGLSAVIETSHHVLVFDTGAKYSQYYDMGDAVVIPFLRSKGISTINTLMISHGDNDHIGGADSVIKQIKVEKIMSSVPEKFSAHTAVKCHAGQEWVWDQVSFKVLSPRHKLFVSDNNNSCVLKVSSKQGSILLTGDIEKFAEHWLVKNAAEQIESQILIAPHHGSKTSSTYAFLKQVNPEIVLIPSGYRNRFSFPHQSVLKRYQTINVRVMNVATDGAIVVELTNGEWEVTSTRLAQRKYWNK